MGNVQDNINYYAEFPLPRPWNDTATRKRHSNTWSSLTTSHLSKKTFSPKEKLWLHSPTMRRDSLCYSFKKRDFSGQENKIKKYRGGTRIWTGDLLICSQMLYHWAIPPIYAAILYLKYLKVLRYCNFFKTFDDHDIQWCSYAVKGKMKLSTFHKTTLQKEIFQAKTWFSSSPCLICRKSQFIVV